MVIWTVALTKQKLSSYALKRFPKILSLLKKNFARPEKDLKSRDVRKCRHPPPRPFPKVENLL